MQKAKSMPNAIIPNENENKQNHMALKTKPYLRKTSQKTMFILIINNCTFLQLKQCWLKAVNVSHKEIYCIIDPKKCKTKVRTKNVFRVFNDTKTTIKTTF